MSEGWVKIHRAIEDWRWHDDPSTFCLFIHLLILANRECREYRGIKIEKGQVVTGRKKLAEITGLSEQMIRTSLEKLKSTSEITIKSTNKYSVITICNYARYQYNQIAEQPTSQPTNQPTTNHKQEGKEDIYILSTRTREDWRNLSSLRKDMLGWDKDRIAEYKRKLIRDELEGIAGKIGLSEEDIDAFLLKWCEHTPGDDRIKAEYEPTFNVSERAKNYIGVGKKRGLRQQKKDVNDKWRR